MNEIVDLHMHVVPGIDDGSRSIEESLQMLKCAAEQGVTDVFCTSHNGYCQDDGERYLASFFRLKDAVTEAKINVRISGFVKKIVPQYFCDCKMQLVKQKSM